MLRRRGFTLIELLVVIGIIGILMGLLIPSLSKAKKQANRTACLSNIRQVYFCFQFYAQNFGDQIPIGYDGPVGAAQADYYAAYGGAPATNPRTLFGLFVDAGLMPNPQVFYCPSESQPQFQFNTPENPWPPVAGRDTYMAFACRPVVQWVNSAVPAPLPKLTKMRNLALVADIISTPQIVGIRHSSGVNVLFGDGSAHYVEKGAYGADLARVGSGAYLAANNVKMLDTSVTPNVGVWGDLDRN
jgi:prepilin-type N-terminal cleavage/methylation domain-containing protein/prepilin-type processing-associated H-X9-DG protein